MAVFGMFATVLLITAANVRFRGEETRGRTLAEIYEPTADSATGQA